jgi:2,5-diketo-D-gluconate reductase B
MPPPSFPNLTVLSHPLIQHKLTILRDKHTSTRDFKQLVSEIAMLMAYEVTKDLATAPAEIETPLEAMTALRDEGRTREIGVSNFTSAQFREALDLAPVIVNQVEYHVYLDQSALLEVCRERSAELCAYRPLGKGQVTSDPVIAEIAEAHGATPAQVALAWLIGQERVSAVPKASSPERRRENLGALRLELSADERAALNALPKDRRAVETQWSPDWD